MKKKIILLMAIAMSIFILVGCTDKEEKYSNDQLNLQKIISYPCGRSEYRTARK